MEVDTRLMKTRVTPPQKPARTLITGHHKTPEVQTELGGVLASFRRQRWSWSTLGRLPARVDEAKQASPWPRRDLQEKPCSSLPRLSWSIPISPRPGGDWRQRRRLTEVRNARLHLQGAHVFSHAGVVLLLGRQIVQLLEGRLVLPADQLRSQKRRGRLQLEVEEHWTDGGKQPIYRFILLLEETGTSADLRRPPPL